MGQLFSIQRVEIKTKVAKKVIEKLVFIRVSSIYRQGLPK